ncbi:MAG: hypothetical protein ACTHKF_02765 [Candidatus Nitrosocosmicus sp.]
MDSYSLLITAIRSDQPRRKYQARLNTFFDHISISNTTSKKRADIGKIGQSF